MKCHTSKVIRNKKESYLENKIHEIEANSKNTNIRDVYNGVGFQEGILI